MSSSHLSFTIPQFPQFKISIHKFSNVTNAAEIKQNLLSGNQEYNFAFINSSTIVSSEQLIAAIYRTLLDYTQDKIRTKTLHSEVIFSLSPTQNIMDSLKRFGIQDDSKELVVINISENGAKDDYNLQIISGEEVKVDDDEFAKTVDYKVIKKNYKFDSQDPELITRFIVNAIQLRGH